MGEVDAVLAESPLMAGLGHFEMAAIERVGRMVECAPGQALCPTTDWDHRLFLLVEGRVALHLDLHSGEHCGGEREIVLERPGDVLGWTLLMKRDRLTALAHCIEPSRLLAVDLNRLPGGIGLMLAKRLAMHLYGQLRRLELCRPEALPG